MENKYYTPTIEEFHVGLEYENCNNGKWDKGYSCRLEHGRDGIHISVPSADPAFYDPRYVRVKLLDREDIESLGWKFSSKGNIFNTFLLSNYWLGFNFNTDNLVITNGKVYEEERFYFDGKIKNKSELQKLMIQLGII